MVVRFNRTSTSTFAPQQLDPMHTPPWFHAQVAQMARSTPLAASVRFFASNMIDGSWATADSPPMRVHFITELNQGMTDKCSTA